jgi:hypothetical protein
MTNIIDLNDALKKRGEIYSFVVCPHCEDETNMAVIVAMLDNGDAISSLVCCGSKCGGEGLEIVVNNGFLGEIIGVDE